MITKAITLYSLTHNVKEKRVGLPSSGHSKVSQKSYLRLHSDNPLPRLCQTPTLIQFLDSLQIEEDYYSSYQS